MTPEVSAEMERVREVVERESPRDGVGCRWIAGELGISYVRARWLVRELVDRGLIERRNGAYRATAACPCCKRAFAGVLGRSVA